MKLVISLYLIFFTCTIYPLIGQNLIKTNSGQNVLLNDDGSWTKASFPEKEDSTGMLVLGFNPLTKPTEEKYNISEAHQKAINLLLSKTETLEIESFITVRNIEKSLAGQETLLSQAKLLKKETEIALIKAKISELNSTLKSSYNTYNNATKNVEICKNLKNKNVGAREKSMMALSKECGVDVSSYMTKEEKSEKQTKQKSEKKNKNCLFAKDEIVNKQRIIQLEKEAFYSYTPQKLQAYFKTMELMNVFTFVQKNGKKYTLHLIIKISSKDAAKNYGIINAESMLRISFISGKIINLYCQEDASPMIETYTSTNIYEAQYSLENEQLNTLENNPIDTIGLMWSSGFESYDIYNVDVLMNQVGCIRSL